MPASQWHRPEAGGLALPQLGIADATVVTVVCSFVGYVYMNMRAYSH